MIKKVTQRFKLKDVTLCLAVMGQVQLHSRGEVPSQLGWRKGFTMTVMC